MPGLHCAVLSLIFLSLLNGAIAADLPPQHETEIQHLLGFVENSGCTFIRNGSENSPQAAADHLRLKYNRGKRYVNTAEQFIDRLASESSWTGNKYTINCGAEVQESGVWLHQALTEYRRHRDQQRSPQLPQ